MAIVLAGGRGSRLHDLTDSDSKPSLPIGRDMRLIDFTLANAVNSGIPQILVLDQYRPETLQRHLKHTWNDIARQFGTAIASASGHDFGGFDGTADAVAKTISQIDRLDPQTVVILAGDHLYQMDYRPFVASHKASGARVTVGAIHVPVSQAREFGVMALDERGRITRFDEKPANPAESLDRPGYALASMGIYVFDWAFLRARLREMAGTRDDLDFGKHVVPALVADGLAHGYALPGRDGLAPLWRDLGTLDAYHAIHQELVDGRVVLDPAWPLLTTVGSEPSVRSATSATTARRHSLVRCSIGRGAIVGENARLQNVVVCPGARIGRNASLTDAIVASDAVIPDGFDLRVALQLTGWCVRSEGGLSLISRRSIELLAIITAQARNGQAARANDNDIVENAWLPKQAARPRPMLIPN